MIRATTGGVMLNYRRNLMNSFITQNNAMNTILTQRNFNSYAEDPAAAAKAFKLRKSRMSVETQYTICNDTYSKYQTGFASLQSMDDVLDTKNGVPGAYMKTLSGTTLSMLNDPTGDAREQLSKVLDQMSEMLVQNMNQKYGESFIFAGADGHNVPFEIKDNKLYYRGVSVDAAVPNLMKDANGDPITSADGNSYVLADASTIKKLEFEENPPGTLVTVTNEDGDTLNVVKGATSITQADYDQLSVDDQITYVKVTNTAGDEVYYKFGEVCSKVDYEAEVAAKALKDQAGNPVTVTVDGQDYYVVEDPDTMITKEDYEAAETEVAKLEYLANEKYFVDIGLGFQENENGQLIESSAFNAALVGIKFFGYGLDEDGDPKNLYSLVQKMREISDSVPEAGKWDDPTWDEFDRLVKKFETACSDFHTEFTDMAAGTEKLDNNLELLKENFYTLQEQYAELEDIEPVEAINNLLWAQYSYNAALKVGNSILSQSLMDYLNV